MIARVNVPAGTVRAVSIPRDLYLEIPGFGYDKITRAYDFGSKADGGSFKGGKDVIKATVLANFGVPVDHVVVTTFTGFQEVVDAVGGAALVNPYDLYDGEFPTIDYGYEEIFYPAGAITLDGANALKFVRTRHQDGDPGRVMRQHLVLLALLAKAQQPEILVATADPGGDLSQGGPQRSWCVPAAGARAGSAPFFRGFDRLFRSQPVGLFRFHCRGNVDLLRRLVADSRFRSVATCWLRGAMMSDTRSRDAAIRSREAGENPIDYFQRRGYVYDITDEAAVAGRIRPGNRSPGISGSIQPLHRFMSDISSE